MFLKKVFRCAGHARLSLWVLVQSLARAQIFLSLVFQVMHFYSSLQGKGYAQMLADLKISNLPSLDNMVSEN